MAKSEEHPSYYAVGGAVEMSETSKEAIVREIFEEMNIITEIDRLAFVEERFFSAGGQRHHQVVFYYLIRTNSDMDIPENSFTDQGSRETLHWLPLCDLKDYDIIPEFLKNKSLTDIKGIEHIVSQ